MTKGQPGRRFKTSPPAPPYYSLSSHFGDNKLYESLGSPRKMIPDVSRSFWYVQFSLSWKLKFHHFFIIFHIHLHFFDFFINFIFFIFRMVFGSVTLKFISSAWFPARGCSLINLGWNSIYFQIFVFIWCPCADLPGYISTLKKIFPYPELEPADARYR